MIDAGFWRGRRVLLTGHTGFKGAWLALWLHSLGARVTGFAGPPPSEPSLFALARVGELLDDVRGDVRDDAAVRGAVAGAGPEVVLHLAAQALVRRSYEDPAETWATNAGGTVNLLEAVRTVSPDAAVVVVTSDKCYANDGSGRALREGDPLGGDDPYSASKAAQELVAASHRAAYGLRVATARAGNVIGGGDWGAGRLVPELVRAALAGEPPVVRNPRATRPWQHVLDPLTGYLLLAERLTAGDGVAEAWNFGPEEAQPVEWLVERFRELWPATPPADAPGDAQPFEAPALRIDASKARGRLGWRPRVPLPDALESTVAWHRAVAGGTPARDVTLEHLRRLERAAATS